MKLNDRVRLKGVVCPITGDRILGTVTGLRGRGEFRVSFDSMTCPCHGRNRGQARSRYWYPEQSALGFETKENWK